MVAKKGTKKGIKKGTKKGIKKGTKKRVMKRSKGSRKNRTRRVKKGGHLDLTNEPSIGDCVKKGSLGLTTYEYAGHKSDGFSMPKILVKSKDGQLINGGPLRDWSKCAMKGGKH
jgi:hypothetical protein